MASHLILSQPFNPSTLLYVDEHNQIGQVSFCGYLWRVLTALFIGCQRAFEDCSSQRVADAINEHVCSSHFNKSQMWTTIQFLREFKAVVRKDSNRMHIDAIANRLADGLLASKKEFVERAINYLECQGQDDLTNSALLFLRDAKNNIDQHRDTPLPMWFHAVKNRSEAEPIIHAREIRQSATDAGYGSCIASDDEYAKSTSSGKYTFAIDEDCIETAYGSYFFPVSETNIFQKAIHFFFSTEVPKPENPPLHVRLEQNIPINCKTLAYFVFSKKDETSRDYQLFRARISLYCPWVKWMDRETSNKISEAFRNSIERTLPSQWNWMDGAAVQPLPREFRGEIFTDLTANFDDLGRHAFAEDDEESFSETEEETTGLSLAAGEHTQPLVNGEVIEIVIDTAAANDTPATNNSGNEFSNLFTDSAASL